MKKSVFFSVFHAGESTTNLVYEKNIVFCKCAEPNDIQLQRYG